MMIIVTRDAQFLAPELREMCVLVIFGAVCKIFCGISVTSQPRHIYNLGTAFVRGIPPPPGDSQRLVRQKKRETRARNICRLSLVRIVKIVFGLYVALLYISQTPHTHHRWELCDRRSRLRSRLPA